MGLREWDAAEALLTEVHRGAALVMHCVAQLRAGVLCGWPLQAYPSPLMHFVWVARPGNTAGGEHQRREAPPPGAAADAAGDGVRANRTRDRRGGYLPVGTAACLGALFGPCWSKVCTGSCMTLCQRRCTVHGPLTSWRSENAITCRGA